MGSRRLDGRAVKLMAQEPSEHAIARRGSQLEVRREAATHIRAIVDS